MEQAGATTTPAAAAAAAAENLPAFTIARRRPFVHLKTSKSSHQARWLAHTTIAPLHSVQRKQQPQALPSTMGLLPAGVASSLSWRARRAFWPRVPLQAAAAAASSAGSTSCLQNQGSRSSAQQRRASGSRRWNRTGRGGGGRGVGASDGGVDRTALAEAPRAVFVWEHMMSILRPDLPNVSVYMSPEIDIPTMSSYEYYRVCCARMYASAIAAGSSLLMYMCIFCVGGVCSVVACFYRQRMFPVRAADRAQAADVLLQ